MTLFRWVCLRHVPSSTELSTFPLYICALYLQSLPLSLVIVLSQARRPLFLALKKCEPESEPELEMFLVAGTGA